MMHHGNCCPRTSPMQMANPVVCPPQYRFHDEFIPQVVPFIHPIVNVNREHIVPIPRHFYTETTENVMGAPATPIAPIGGGFGPEFGPGFGRGRGFGFGRGGRGFGF